MPLQRVRLVAWQICESLYGFLVIVRDISQELLANALVSQSLLDFVRFAVNIASQFGNGCRFRLPKATS
jgi:hypothetical protein